MSNEEPVQTLQEQPQETQVTKLKLQAPETTMQIPRPINVFAAIHQWQPMGFRVTIKLPFVGNDWSYLFLIRNGPFIPNYSRTLEYVPELSSVGVYGFNNMRPVFLNPEPLITDKPTVNAVTTYPDNYQITMSVYDFPPLLSTLAECFRRWRGDMQYRVRVVAGFGTQGYLVGSTLKNEIMPIGIYDEYKQTPLVSRNDFSYRELMAHSYVMSDTSMFRHLELTVPYDYPTPFYDQYDWISHRVVPAGISEGKGFSTRHTCVIAPHGDNFVVVGLRGSIDAPSTTTMQFELEYRAVEGFQFSEPGLPPRDALRSRTSYVKNPARAKGLVRTYPDSSMESDGLGTIREKKTGKTLSSSWATARPPAFYPGTRREPNPPVVDEPVDMLPKHAPSSSSSPAITYPYGPSIGIYKSVAVERRGGQLLTHAQRKDGTFISWSGDVRPYIQAALVEEDLWHNTQLHRVSPEQIISLSRKVRDIDFA